MRGRSKVREAVVAVMLALAHCVARVLGMSITAAASRNRSRLREALSNSFSVQERVERWEKEVRVLPVGHQPRVDPLDSQRR